MNTSALWKVISLLVAVTLLTACGGGSSSSPAPAPTKPSGATLLLSLEPIKNFQFSWASVDGATYYTLMENPDGASGFTQVDADIPQGTLQKEHIVSLPKRINAQYVLQSCNAQGCTDSAIVSVAGTLVTSVGYLKASNAEAGDEFGYSISLSADGHTLAVGMHLEDSNATGIDGSQANNLASDSGAVYLFTRTGAIWNQQAYLKASNAEAGDEFGYSVSLSADGNTLAVGAIVEDSNATGVNGSQANNLASDSGAVYLFTRTGATWNQQAYLKASNTGGNDWFGSTISLSDDGNTLAVGVRDEDSNATGIGGDQNNNLASSSGAVYLFFRTGSDWTQQAYLKASNTGFFDGFGTSISLSADGNALVVGAIYEDSDGIGIDGNEANDNVTDSGAVYLFFRTGSDWSQQAYLKASNAEANDSFGASVSLSDDGNTLAVGAIFEGSNATGIDGSQFDNSASDSGAVYLFTRTGATWSQQAYLKASNTEASDNFGGSVLLSADGNALAVAAANEGSSATGINGNQVDNSASNSGAVYLFTRSVASWTQQVYLKASNTEASDKFGHSVALSGDGNTLAVAAVDEDSNARVIDGDQTDNSAGSSGAVYLY